MTSVQPDDSELNAWCEIATFVLRNVSVLLAVLSISQDSGVIDGKKNKADTRALVYWCQKVGN